MDLLELCDATWLCRIKRHTSFQICCVLAFSEAVTNYCAFSSILLSVCGPLLQQHYWPLEVINKEQYCCIFLSMFWCNYAYQ